VLGALVLRLLRNPQGWIHRRVESVTVSDPVVTERRVSLDFTLGQVRPVAVNGNGEEIHFIPLAFMRKQPMVKFSLTDEAGKALPVLTYHRNGAVSLSVLVVLGEALVDFPGGPIERGMFPMPHDLIDDLRSIVMGDPIDKEELRARIQNLPCRPAMDARSIAWRDFLADDEEFKKAAHVLSHRFLLAVPLVGPPGVRRIIKYSFEEHGDQPKIKMPKPVRWLVRAWARIIAGRPPENIRFRDWSLWLFRGIGWKPMASEIKAPLMGHAGRYHFEVEAAEGLQITLAQLKTEKRRDPDGKEVGGELVDECATSRQRVHLYSRVNEPGFVVVAARPRPFTIVRTGLMASFLSVVVLAVVCIFSGRLVQNIGPAVSVLLLAPAVLAAYIARPIDQPATNEAVFGLRMLAMLSGVWPLLAALMLAGGTDCETIAAKPGHSVESVCHAWSFQLPSLLLLLGLAIVNCLLLLAYMTLVNRPPEQQRDEVALKGADSAP
jgi:hypothetical protein